MVPKEEQELRSFINWYNNKFTNYEALPKHLITMFKEEIEQYTNIKTKE